MKQLMTAEEMAIKMNLFHKSGKNAGKPNMQAAWRIARRLPAGVVITIPGSRLIRIDPDALDRVLSAPPDVPQDAPAFRRRSLSVVSSLKTEKKNGKRAVVSVERKDVLCL
jgi:hypothetical protein